MGRIWSILFVAVAAIAGAIAGRVGAEMRRQREAAEPLNISLDDVKIRLQDIVPGLVAALRVRDTPWSWLHIPSWLAAFGVNFGVGAVGGDLSRLRDMAERAAFGIAGIEIPCDEPEVEAVYEVARDEPAPTSTPMYAATREGAHGSGSVTWTAPSPLERRDDAPAGFTVSAE